MVPLPCLGIATGIMESAAVDLHGQLDVLERDIREHCPVGRSRPGIRHPAGQSALPQHLMGEPLCLGPRIGADLQHRRASPPLPTSAPAPSQRRVQLVHPQLPAAQAVLQEVTLAPTHHVEATARRGGDTNSIAPRHIPGIDNGTDQPDPRLDGHAAGRGYDNIDDGRRAVVDAVPPRRRRAGDRRVISRPQPSGAHPLGWGGRTDPDEIHPREQSAPSTAPKRSIDHRRAESAPQGLIPAQHSGLLTQHDFEPERLGEISRVHPLITPPPSGAKRNCSSMWTSQRRWRGREPRESAGMWITLLQTTGMWTSSEIGDAADPPNGTGRATT